MLDEVVRSSGSDSFVETSTCPSVSVRLLLSFFSVAADLVVRPSRCVLTLPSVEMTSWKILLVSTTSFCTTDLSKAY